MAKRAVEVQVRFRLKKRNGEFMPGFFLVHGFAEGARDRWRETQGIALEIVPLRPGDEGYDKERKR